MNTQKILSIGSNLINTVKKIFPQHAEYELGGDSNGFYCLIDWKLHNDKIRPNKRSRIIKIIISTEALDDYNDSSLQLQQSSQTNLYKHINSKYRKFNPDHNVPKGREAPVEES